METDYAGNATYTFTLRSNILWSNGEAVTSHHFAAAWKRLADPANALPDREILSMIAGYDTVQETGDTSHLGISTPDDLTLIVTLNGNPAYFLETVCAGVSTMPIRSDLFNPKNLITNGPYTVTEFSDKQVRMERSETYYDAAKVTVESILFLPATGSQTDYDALLAGEADFSENLPMTAAEELALSGLWIPEPVTSTLALVFNTLSAPLDSPEIRAALHLAIDEQVITDALADLTFRPATGLVPYGVSDFSEHTEENAEDETTEPSLPDPNAPPRETPPEPEIYWDFRTHSEEIVTVDTGSDYTADCNSARDLLAAAGYPNGSGLPTLDYVFLNTEENVTIANAVQKMWKEQLGISVMLRAVSEEELTALITPVTDEETGLTSAPFQIVATEFSAAYSDASALLFRWHSADPGNFTGYSSPAFDILIGAAEASVSPEAYDAYLHDAEAILLTDAPLIPLCYRGSSVLLRDGLEGLYRLPNGIFFFSRVTRSQTA